MKTHQYDRLWADVNLDSIRSNILNLRAGLQPGTKSCAVIKADAYGHGAIQVADAIDDLVDHYAVATMDEAMELRNHGIIKPILILGFVHPDFLPLAIQNNVSLTVYDMDFAEAASKAAVREGEPVSLHIKIDVGMGRIGFQPNAESIELIKQIHALEGIALDGIYTHFPLADDETTDATMKQFEAFNSFTKALENEGISFKIKHCSNSAAATRLKAANMNMVRLGISIYGLYPSEYVRDIKLEPALSLKSHVVFVKDYDKGQSVGYGSTWTASRKSRIATIPVGYADGYFRSLSNKGYVLIKGEKYPIAGRVCMDQFMVDVTGSDIKKGDEVTLIGADGQQVITTEEISELAGSFNYEFVCGLGRRVPRIYSLKGHEIPVKNDFEGYYHSEN